MTTRPAVRAGTFYEGNPQQCQQRAREILEQARVPKNLPRPRYGGLVPHAGWAFSGRLAAMTLKALLAETQPPVHTVVFFGADHMGFARKGEVWSQGSWNTPLGEVSIDEELAGKLIQESTLFRENPSAHEYEHSIEVQIPFVRLLGETIQIVPIACPAEKVSLDIGRFVGRIVAQQAPGSVVLVGSTDLTHHGGHFGYVNGKHGPQSEVYARENDRRILDCIEAMDAEATLTEASTHHNACGGGAVVATIAATTELGAKTGRVLEYTNSYEVMRKDYPGQSDDTTVGYASVVFV